MKESKISLMAVEGNVFDMKAFHDIDGYDEVSLEQLSGYVSEDLDEQIL